MAAGADCHFKFISPREVACAHGILLMTTLHDRQWFPLGFGIPVKAPSGALIRGIARQNEPPLQLHFQLCQCVRADFRMVRRTNLTSNGCASNPASNHSGLFDEVTPSKSVHEGVTLQQFAYQLAIG